MQQMTLWLNSVSKVLFSIIIMGSIYTCITSGMYQQSPTALVLLGIWSGLGFLFYKLRYKLDFKVLFTGIFLISLGLRVLWFLNIDSLPVSDFGLMFYNGSQFIQGHTDMFKGISYFARFPHMSLTVMYFGLIQYLFADALTMTRVINIGLSLINIVLLYFIAQQLFRDRHKSLGVMLLAGICPPMIYYNNVFASENLALPLLLLSVLFYLRGVNDQKIITFLGSGLCLSLAHLFRPLLYVVLVAYVLYALIYYQNHIRAKLKAVLSVVLASLLPFVLISLLLVRMDITQYPLWHGTEPLTVSVLKGTNISSGGGWNQADASVFSQFNGDYEAVNQECQRLIKQRFTATPPGAWLKFYLLKYSSQWSSGDFGGAYWAEAGRTDLKSQALFAQGIHRENKMVISMLSQGFLFHQLVWIVLLILSLRGLFRQERSAGQSLQLLYILFAGFALFYLITESQSRYGYIACWIFPILALTSFRGSAEQKEAGDKLC